MVFAYHRMKLLYAQSDGFNSWLKEKYACFSMTEKSASLTKYKIYILAWLSCAFFTIANLEWGSKTDSSVYGGSLVPCNIKLHSFTNPNWGVSELNFAWNLKLGIRTHSIKYR